MSSNYFQVLHQVETATSGLSIKELQELQEILLSQRDPERSPVFLRAPGLFAPNGLFHQPVGDAVHAAISALIEKRIREGEHSEKDLDN